MIDYLLRYGDELSQYESSKHLKEIGKEFIDTDRIYMTYRMITKPAFAADKSYIINPNTFL